MEVNVKWNGRVSFTGVGESGHAVRMNSDPTSTGEEGSVSPMEMMALSLAGCTAMDVISILEKKRQEVTDFDVHASIQRAEEHPRVFESAVILFKIVGRAVEEDAVRRAIKLSATRYCPAQAMLAKVFPIQLEYVIFEEGNLETPVIEGVLVVPA